MKRNISNSSTYSNSTSTSTSTSTSISKSSNAYLRIRIPSFESIELLKNDYDLSPPNAPILTKEASMNKYNKKLQVKNN